MPEARRVPIRFPEETSLTARTLAEKDAKIDQWQARAWDLLLQNDLLRLSVDILRQELVEEKAKHGSV